MKNLLRFSFLSLLMIGLFTACEEDPITGGGEPGGGEVNPDAPSLRIVDKDGFVSTTATIQPGAVFNVNLLGAKGAADLFSVEFDIDGAPFGASSVDRITINNATVDGDNVQVESSELASIDWDVSIVAQQDESTQTYMFNLVDQDNLRDVAEVTITTDFNAGGGGTVVAPTIGGLPMGTVIVDMNSSFRIQLDVAAGNPVLRSMSVLEDILGNGDPSVVDPMRLEFGGQAVAENPFLLEGADKQGFMKDLFVRAQDDQSLREYIIAFEDEAGNVYFESFFIDTRPQGNQVTTKRGILFNRAGPAGTGGLDLDEGEGTGSSDVEAEIKDNGIDTSVPNAQNWLQTISGVNGVELKYLVPGQNGLPGDFTFETTTLDVQISNTWGFGTDFSITNSDGEASSNPVNEGDMFIANKNGQYYLFVIREVNATGNDNNDNYVMDISY